MKLTAGLSAVLAGVLIFSLAEATIQAQIAMSPATVAPQTETQRNAAEIEGLKKKLNSIVIPQLDFRQANIVDVIKYLDRQAIIADTNSPAGTRGVNFILHLRRPGAAAEIAPPVLTMSLHNIALMDAIRFIAEVAGLKYRIEESAVIITPGN